MIQFNLPLILTLPYFLYFILVILLTRITETRVRQTYEDVDSNIDAGTLKTLVNSYRASRILAIIAAIFLINPLPILSSTSSIYIGLLLMLLGQTGRYISFSQLGKYFTGHISVPDKVFQEGIYRYIRHPGYTSGFIYIVGMGLCFTNLYSLATLIIFYILSTAKRIKREEQILSEHLFDYKEYSERVARFIPFIF